MFRSGHLGIIMPRTASQKSLFVDAFDKVSTCTAYWNKWIADYRWVEIITHKHPELGNVGLDIGAFNAAVQAKYGGSFNNFTVG